MRALSRASLAGSFALLSFAVAASLPLATRDADEPVAGNRTLLAAAVSSCEDSQQARACIERAVQDSLERTSIPSTAQDLVTVLREDQDSGGVCHEAMHWLGRQAARNYRTHLADLRTVFPACAFGLMHGLMESIQLPAEVEGASREIEDICSSVTAEEQALEPGSEGYYVLTDCAHGAGHSLGSSKPGDLDYAFAACRQAFEDEGLKVACVNGAGMSNVYETTKYVASLDHSGELPVSVWDEVTEPICSAMGDLKSQACAGVFVQVAVDVGPHAEKGFLKWCQQRYPESARTCFDSTGVALSVSGRTQNWPIRKVAEEMKEVCAAADTDELLIVCWAGLGNGLTQRGLRNEDAALEACSVFDDFLPPGQAKRACSDARTQLSSGAILEMNY